MGERTRIARYFAPLAAAEAGSFFLTDDAAVIAPPAGQKLVITTDSVIEGTHVLPGATPQQFAQKLMRRNLSDLAAMGAAPWRYTLNIHTAFQTGDDWFAEFSQALANEQKNFGLLLIGGDTTSGGQSIHTTMTCFGLLDGAPLRRNGAQLGDDVYMSGSIGGAAYALHLLQHCQPVEACLAAHYHRPEPRLALGAALRGIASSAIDISDGLVADATQICSASHVGMRITRRALPLPTALVESIAQDISTWRFALSGGDDYELCFTASPAQRAAIDALGVACGVHITHIGVVVDRSGVSVIDDDGQVIDLPTTGWEH